MDGHRGAADPIGIDGAHDRRTGHSPCHDLLTHFGQGSVADTYASEENRSR